MASVVSIKTLSPCWLKASIVISTMPFFGFSSIHKLLKFILIEVFVLKTLNFIIDKAKGLNKRAVFLTVNKGNARAISVYERFGFKKIHAVVTDIGGGFVMDDYIYQLDT